AYIVISAKIRPGREEIVEPDRDADATKSTEDAKTADADATGKDGAEDADAPETDSADEDPLKKDRLRKDSAPEAADKS
ncbi:prolipoprotein diacylglyceryl transferase, partial [Streptomyces turgidiscabies]